MPEAAETKDSDLAGQISVYKNSSDLKDSNADKKYYSINFGSTYSYKVEALGDIDNDIAALRSLSSRTPRVAPSWKAKRLWLLATSSSRLTLLVRAS